MTNNELRAITVRAMLLEGAYWAGLCMHAVFLVTTLLDYGWSSSAVVASMTAMSVISMPVQPIYGYLCDKYISDKNLTLILLALSILCLILFPFALRSGSTVLVILNMVGIALTITQVPGLLDAWIVGLKQEIPEINYGVMRGTGAFSFAIAAQLAGTITTAYGHEVRLWIGSFLFAITMLLALSLRESRRTKPAPDNSQQLTGFQALKLVFSSKRYSMLLSVSFFLMLNTATNSTLLQLIIRDFGGTAAHVGTLSAVMAMSEVPAMFMMAFIMRKVGFQRLLVLCCSVYVLRMFVTANIGTVNGLIWIQLLQSLSFAVLTPISMSYLSQILDERVRSTAVTTYGAITGGLTGILGNLLTSTLLGTGFTPQQILLVFACTTTVGLLVALYGVVKKIW